MKHWLGLVALLCLGTSAQAAVDTYEVGCTTYTSFTVAIASYAANATPLFAATLSGGTTDFFKVVRNRKYIEIQNIDVSSNALCAIGVVSSTTPANYLTYTRDVNLSSTVGRLIPSNGGIWKFSLPPTNPSGKYLIPWCMNTGAAGVTNISVGQCGAD